MKQFIKYIALIVCACSCWACMDDEIGQEIDYSKPATVNMSIDFSEMQMVTPGTRSAGDAIGKMTDLCVLFYDTNGNLATDENGPIYHYTTVNSQELAKITEKVVPAGTYKVVAVANMGNLVINETYKETVKSLTNLKAISLQWNNEDITKNNQMFGFFSFTEDNSIDAAIKDKGMNQVAPTSYDAPEVVLAGPKTIFAKLYRTVSKVTVAFDGEGLNRNVFVTINSIRLGNLPQSSPLWVENKNVTETLDAEDGNSNVQSEILDDKDFGLLRVTNRGPGESTVPKNAHSQTGPSLFVFENRQGTATTTGHKDKTKTKKPYGTFIEIEAYYANEETGSKGKIIYRYMLGEDLPNNYDNYNLTRNRHYKVTLMLQKSGKEEPYWRVEYNEDPFITLPTEVNISYRNSAKLDIPFKVEKANDITRVEAKIINNPWFDDLIDGHRDATVEAGTLTGNTYGFLAWAGSLSDNNAYGNNKTGAITVQQTGEGYQLSVQTESLGFKTDRGNETADSFTGYNNYSNPRTAEVEVIVTYNTGEQKTAKVKIVQVPRIVNPIAIYRSWNNAEAFKIRLLNALGKEIESYGPWEAKVEKGSESFEIKRENSASYSTSITSGDEGGAIRFDYKPKSTLTNEKEVRCGVIVVRFSNYNVEHRIYVRQGYAPMAIGSSPSLWTSYNYIGVDGVGKHQLTSSPIEEGAWLRYGNTMGILANNSDNKDGFESPSGSFKMSNGTNLAWSKIESSSTMPTIPGYELPKKQDIENLHALREHSGFGIAYDDQATQTVVFDEEAQYTNPAMGRRGFVICDDKGRNMFLPTGKRGYGRRQSIQQGGLHYTHATTEPSSVARPALIGLPRAMGAIYWAADGSDMLSLNYSLSNIERAVKADNGLSADACFARLLKGDDNITFTGDYYFISAEFNQYQSKILSIEAWGSVTDAAFIPTGQAFSKVSFKYNVEIDRAQSGVIITGKKDNNSTTTYRKKFSIMDLEKIANMGIITLEKVP